ncbi:hypothetical protein N8I77_011923 [Diaporthe amygdali]|uniref:Uncharacterized protein n=2 Tax=Phomopsis amygdali TaxID=1214568 RepID=A0AAD9W066_PHOAM|nr:hypothetical protein N8I77_011923 [Diaporthe amygdali]
MAVTNKDIAAWKASLDKNYNKIKADYAKAKAAGDKAKMKTLGKKMKSNLKDDKTWTNLAAAEKALGAK